uniref:Uncharacterized protein n=1 Tax=Rhizophora mucronata TaxID=61149 RepID=A0A2P2Q5T1_RHIMU
MSCSWWMVLLITVTYFLLVFQFVTIRLDVPFLLAIIACQILVP